MKVTGTGRVYFRPLFEAGISDTRERDHCDVASKMQRACTGENTFTGMFKAACRVRLQAQRKEAV